MSIHSRPPYSCPQPPGSEGQILRPRAANRDRETSGDSAMQFIILYDDDSCVSLASAFAAAATFRIRVFPPLTFQHSCFEYIHTEAMHSPYRRLINTDDTIIPPTVIPHQLHLHK